MTSLTITPSTASKCHYLKNFGLYVVQKKGTYLSYAYSAGMDTKARHLPSHAIQTNWGHLTGYALAWYGLVGATRVCTQGCLPWPPIAQVGPTFAHVLILHFLL
jgi:hypothetical protein